MFKQDIYQSYFSHETHSVVLLKEKFISELEIVIKKRSTQKVTIDEEWLSEKEMKDDYGWTSYLDQIFGAIKLTSAYFHTMHININKIYIDRMFMDHDL